MVKDMLIEMTDRWTRNICWPVSTAAIPLLDGPWNYRPIRLYDFNCGEVAIETLNWGRQLRPEWPEFFREPFLGICLTLFILQPHQSTSFKLYRWQLAYKINKNSRAKVVSTRGHSETDLQTVGVPLPRRGFLESKPAINPLGTIASTIWQRMFHRRINRWGPSPQERLGAACLGS